jgi:hypothetical protein
MAQEKKQVIDLGLTRQASNREMEKAIMELRTDKGFRGGLRSSATVFWTNGTWKSCELFGDFSKTVMQNPNVRATQKAIDTQHAQVFTPAAIAALTAEALAHYAAEVVDAVA